MAFRKISIPGQAAICAAFAHLGPAGSLRRQLTANVAGSLALALSSKVFMLLASVLLARLMGAAGYGVYATAMAIALLLSVPASLGLPTLVLRFVASYRVHQQWGLIRGLLTGGNQAVLCASVLTAGLAGLVIWLSASRLGPEKAVTFGLALIWIPLAVLGAMRSTTLRGLHHVLLGQVPESVIMPALFLALIGLWWVVAETGHPFSPEVAIGARLIATALAFVGGTLFLLKRIPAGVRSATPQYDARAWSRSALPFLLINGMIVINMQTDVLMLAAISGSDSAGIYQAAARGAELVAFSLVIVNMAIQPTISRLYAAGDMIRLQKVATLGARTAAALALPLALVMIFFSQPIMANVFGVEFARGAIALAILAAAQVFNAATGCVNDLLNMTGHERDTAVGMAMGAIANIALNMLLIPIWDLTGAAMATGASLILWNLWLVGRVHRRLGIAATAFGRLGAWTH
jgi:O-antigen/teichoic acid export membrane protein